MSWLKRYFPWLYERLPCAHEWKLEGSGRYGHGCRPHRLRCVKCDVTTGCECERCRQPWRDW